MTDTVDLYEALEKVLNSKQFGKRTLHESQVQEICDAIIPVIADQLAASRDENWSAANRDENRVLRDDLKYAEVLIEERRQAVRALLDLFDNVGQPLEESGGRA